VKINRNQLLAFLLLAAAVFIAYEPAWRGGMLWDDDKHLTSAALRSASGLWRIWFDLGATQQYYPLMHSAFWVQDKLWGANLTGYHLVTIALHAMSAGIVLMILKRLSVPGALMAAVLFALHPVQVESVAWLSELKNTLSGVFYLAAMLTYLRFDRHRRVGAYLLAFILFLAALLAKTVTATLPGALLVVFWWQRGRLEIRRDVLPLAPFAMIGIGAGLFTAWVERTVIGASGTDFQLSIVERCLVAGHAFWFYLRHLVWPGDLAFSYARWSISASDPVQWLYLLSAIALVVVCWIERRRSRAPLAAVLLFAGTLVPVLGFFNVYPFRFSFVADHFQYLAAIPIFALAAAAVDTVWTRRSRATLWLKPFALAALTAVLILTTRAYAADYADAETLYTATIQRTPTSWMAYGNLGKLELERGRLQQALGYLTEAVRLKPDSGEALNDLGSVLHRLGRVDDAAERYEMAIRAEPALPEAHNNLCAAFQQLGRTRDAIAQCEEALRLRPDYAEAHMNLGAALYLVDRVDDAIVHFREAVRLAPDSAQAQANLKRALAGAGR